MDVTNISMICRRRLPKLDTIYTRFLPGYRGPIFQLIGLVGFAGVATLEIKRGLFTRNCAKDWIIRFLTGYNGDLTKFVIVHDNAHHEGLQAGVKTFPEDNHPNLLSMGPHIPSVNPMEPAWEKIKRIVKSHNRSDAVKVPNIGLQKSEYLESLITAARDSITIDDCCKCVEHFKHFLDEIIPQVEAKNMTMTID